MSPEENRKLYKPDRKLSILHVILAVRETSAPYNEHCLPWAEKRDITICSYFDSDLKPPQTITFHEGNGTLSGFFRALQAAFNQKEYDVIHVHSPHLGLLFLLATLFAHRQTRRSTVVTVHDSFQNYKFRNKLLFLPVFSGFQRIVCCSQASYQSFPSFFRWLAGERLCYAQNGLDIERVDRIAANASQQTRSTANLTAVAICRLVEIKNPFTLLDAFQASGDPNSSLILIGDGPLRTPLEKRSIEIGIERAVKFTGLIPRENVFTHLLNADVYISASRGEGLPVSVLEAMACGLPVILSDIPPHREIADGVDLIPLIDPEDTTGFARELSRFRGMSVLERRAIGQRCRKLVEERFSLPAMHATYTEIYTQVVDNHISLPLEVAL